MEQMRELINSIILYMTNHSEVRPSIPWSEIVALIAVVGSGYGVFRTIEWTRKLQNANARVEWIQNVRDTTAELIAAYYSVLNDDSKVNVQKSVVDAREKHERLTLYFGHENKKSPEAKNIVDTDTNNGKNEMIVNYLRELSSNYLEYNSNVQQDIWVEAEARHNEALSMLGDVLAEFSGENIGPISFKNSEYDINPMWASNYGEDVEAIRAKNEFKNSMNTKLSTLSEIMRIYLKIEWNKAKKGK